MKKQNNFFRTSIINKSLLIILFHVLITSIVYGQAPMAIPYQGVARDVNGNILANQNISLRIGIKDLTAGGIVVFSETHNLTTTNLGLFDLNIGQGTPVTGTLAGVNWGGGAKFLQVEMDPAGGSSYVDMGTTQLMSVPYALFAGSSGNIPSGTTNGNTLRWNGTQWIADNAIYNNGTNVGIGTTTPAWKLHLAGTVTGLQIQDTDDASSIFLFAPGNGYTGGVGTTTNHDLALFTNNQDRMTIKAGTGNVGIGTLSPSEKLDVVGKIKTSNFQMTNGAAANTILTGDASGNAAWAAISSLSITEVDPEVSSSATNRVPKWNGTSLTDGIITDNGNNIGIGTTSPTRKLHLSGTIADLRIDDSDDGSSIWLSAPGTGYTGGVGTTSNHDLALFTNSIDRMTVKAGTGNVGIGTLNPSTKLEVIAPGNNIGVQILSGDPNQLTYLSVGRTTSEAQFGVTTNSTFFLDATPGDLAIKNFGLTPGKILLGASYIDNSAMAIVPGGNVGIGNSNPGARLDVSGNGKMTFDNPVATPIMKFISGAGFEWPAISLEEPGANGAILYGIPASGGGLAVGNSANNFFAPVQASAFVVMSDRRMKNNIYSISEKDYDNYLTQIRKIESAKFSYNYETNRNVPHIGVISQTLPIELLSEITEKPGAGSEKRIGVSLADMAGLTLVGVKALDYNQQQMQNKMEEQEKKINDLLKAVDSLKAEIESLKSNK